MTKRSSRAALAAVAIVLSSAIAQAAPTGGDKAMATHLFDEAQKLLESHDYAIACLKLRESQRLDPQLGTMLHLADCYEKEGKTASAWAAFKDGAEVAAKRGDPRESVARERAAALEAHLSRLTIAVTTTPPVQAVLLDGEVIGRPLWGSASPIDPGAHKIVVKAKGRQD